MAPRANLHQEEQAANTGLWAAIVLIATLFGFVLGYSVSSGTGVEPGYFDAPEAGGYGVAPTTGTPGMSEEVRKYYEGLMK